MQRPRPRRSLSGRARPGVVRRATVLATSATLALGLSTAAAASQPAQPQQAAAPPGDQAAAEAVSVLVYHGEATEQDDPVADAAAAIEQLGAQTGEFAVETSSDPAVFSDDKLDAYRGVVFLSADGADLNGGQEAALRRYVQDGGGFLGVRDAARAQPQSDWFTGLLGARPAGSRPTPLEIANVTASGENPPNETASHAVDGKNNTKWLTFDSTGQLAAELAEPTAVSHYALVSANDFPGRDPKDWTLQGSNDGESWTDLDQRTGEDFPDRFQAKQYRFDNDTSYAHYRLDITANDGEDAMQLAEFELYSGEETPPEKPQPQEATVSVVDRQHPANKGLPLTWSRTDAWPNWENNPVGEVHTVAQVQEHTYDPGNTGNGPFHPISWCHDYDGGRAFYTGMGGTAESYDERNFRGHLLGALEWTTGIVRGDCQATIGDNYTVERLTEENLPGRLNQMGEPHGLTTADDGTVFYVGKAACATGPVPDWESEDVGLGCGTIHQWDPETGQASLLASLEVFGNRGSGGELVKTEEGLLGMELDPDFSDNGWFYVYWMPYESIDTEKRIGERTVSRFTYDHGSSSVDEASRVDLLAWDTQIHSCCHAGGGMDFDDEGNLYIATGDSNSSQGSEGYSGNNWTEDYEGVSFQDARRTSGNTNDLNGKILRIHPEDDGSYTVPEGNLFPADEYSGDKTQPEIYVMGVRNPARLHYDPVNDWITTAWVGPDAGEPSPDLGPAKYETATVITEAGNHGWPYCMGNGQPYRDRSNTDASELTGWYDCDNPKNTSPRNTGLEDLPPVKDNMIWYSPQGGGPVYPEREDGSGLPTYELGDETFTQPYLKGGGQAVMDGPTYHRSQVDTGSGVAWPEYWNGKWFLGDQSNANNRVAVTVDPGTVDEAGAPVFGEDLRHIVPPGGDDTELQSWMDAEFGPDGALYLLDYAGGFFSLDDNQKLIRVTYDGGPATPAPNMRADAVQNKPLTVGFTGERSGGVSYAWDFGDGTTSSAANPTHTYDAVGNYTATLTVTYADGETATVEQEVAVECAVPDSNRTVHFRDTDTNVRNHEAAGGCTVDDLIDDESSWAEKSAFVSHVKEVTRDLRKDGVLDKSERQTLVKAARQSDIGGEGDNGYESIFNGTPQSLDGWEQADAGAFSLRPDGSLRSSGGMGMLWYSKQAYGDFSLKLQFRDIAPEGHRANTGVFVRFPDPRTPLEQRPATSCGTKGSARNSQAWVGIYCGHEIQIYDGETGEPQKTGSVYNFDSVYYGRAGVTPKEQWNDYEIRVVDQHYTITRNGKVINEFDNSPGTQSSRDGDPPTDLRQFVDGYIGLQNHGDNDLVEFRNIRVRQL
ncbi:cytochrome C [Saccharomonospora piscinae]|uniref:Cytochrome C n=1 Tax=Saccharomonospora piscinae TaxID=687388 RepID=A0A1V9ABZ2_SACPI|nr:ThuA domain-containing protein [Saccharomonospora piscinae]OQO94600.1 cytochrome C [Saccharomonospora piscinae]